MKRNKRSSAHHTRQSSAEKEENGPLELDSTSVSKRDWYWSVFIGLVGMLLYVNTSNHGYVLDDFSVIKDNWLVKQGASGIPQILETHYRFGYWSAKGTLYRPLSLVMFALEWEYFPDQPSISHRVNVLLYLITGMLLYLLLRLMMRKYNFIIPLLTSLIFIMHPIHTEVVANIKSRDELMSVIFVLLMLYSSLKFADTKKYLWLIVGLGSYFLAFVAKEGVITLLAIVPLVLHFFRDITIKNNALISFLMIFPAGAYLYIRSRVLGGFGGIEHVDVLDNLLIGASGLLERFTTAIAIIGKYLFKVVVPTTLSCDYSLSEIQLHGFDMYFLVSFGILLTMIVVAIIGFKSKSIVSFGILFFGITFSIYSNLFVVIGSSFGERFMYLPLLGLALSFSFIMIKFLKVETGVEYEILLRSKAMQKVGLILLPLLMLCGGKTISRNLDWKSDFSLYEADVQNAPNSARTHYYYALELVKSKGLKSQDIAVRNEFFKQAIVEFSKALAIHQAFPDAYDQMGLAYFRLGDMDKALENYNLSLKYNPTKATTYSNLGAIYFNKKEYQNALEVYKKAVYYDPRFADAYMNLGSAQATLGQLEDAILSFSNCIKYEPNNANAHYFLAVTKRNQKDLEGAVSSFRNSVHYQPSKAIAHFDLGITLKALGRIEEGNVCLTEAVRLDPNLQNRLKGLK